MSDTTPWWDAEKGEVFTSVLNYVSAVEQGQADIFDRFVKLDYLYDPNGGAEGAESPRSMLMDQMSENVIASNVDTVTATITASEVRPRMVTDDGDWSVQRNAQAMSWYAEGISKLLDVHHKCVRGFHAGALKGKGLNKVFINAFDEICVEPTMIDDIVVDEAEVRAGRPRQMHQRMLVDRQVLKSEFYSHAEEIDRAQKNSSDRDWSYWAGYRPLESDEIVVIESWYLPIGRPGKKGYREGRHTIVIDGIDLLDEAWEKPAFPFAEFTWIEKTKGYYGIGLGERIVGHQRELNRMNWTEGHILEKMARPTTWVRPVDQNIRIQTSSRLGNFGVYNGDLPQTVTPEPLSAQFLNRRREVKGSSYEEGGVSQMQAHSAVPSGIESGVGLREYRDQRADRFSRQEKGFERFCLDTIWLVLECAKELGDKAPKVARKAKYGPRSIEWRQVESDEIRVQLVASSNMGRTPAGRSALVMEMAQGGVISTDMARRLLMPNSSLDVEREMSMYTAALENIEAAIEEIKDGGDVVPEPYGNNKMAVWRGQMAYLQIELGGAPEEVLESLRQFITQAAWLVSQSEMQPEALPADPAQPQQAGAPELPAPMGAL